MAHYREYRAVCEDMARLKHKLGELGLFKTMALMDEATRIVGFEVADRLHPSPTGAS